MDTPCPEQPLCEGPGGAGIALEPSSEASRDAGGWVGSSRGLRAAAGLLQGGRDG